jgi:chromosome segregation and condensation protein ScpB
MKDAEIQVQLGQIIDAVNEKIKKAKKAVSKVEKEMETRGVALIKAAPWPFPTGDTSVKIKESDIESELRTKLLSANLRVWQLNTISQRLSNAQTDLFELRS